MTVTNHAEVEISAEGKFLVTFDYDGDSVTAIMGEKRLSDFIDMSDANDIVIDYRRIYYLGGKRPVRVRLNKDLERINTEEEAPFRFAQQAWLTKHGAIVGYVTRTDH